MLYYGWGSLEQDYLVIVMGDGWGLADFVLMTNDVNQMLTSVKQSTKILIDLRYAGTPPSNFIVVAGKFFEKLPSNVDSFIMISSVSFWKSLFQITHDIYAPYSSNIYAVPSVDKAYHLLISDATT